MNTKHRLIYRFGHLWSISASLGLWLLLLWAVPDGLLTATHAWIDKGLTDASKVLLASGGPTELPVPAILCAEQPQQTSTVDCLRNSL